MRTGRVIVLHTIASSDPSVRAARRGRAGSPQLSTFQADASTLKKLRDQPGVEIEAPSFDVKLIEPVKAMKGAAKTTSPKVSWGIEAVGADASPCDGTGVVVAVLDTGIFRKHAAFKDIDVVEKDFTKEGNGDANGHGTHCAGTICGGDVEGTRIGIARGVEKLLIGKVLGEEGGGSSDAIADAMQWAIGEGAHVLSMSLGMDFPGFQKALVAAGRSQEVATSLALEGYRENVRLFDRVAGLIAAGEFMGRRAIIVAATGNESRRDLQSSFTIAKGPPAAADGFLSVAAVEQAQDPKKPYKIASFSNTKADIAAPGVDIWSAWTGPGGKKLMSLSGTSMATPHVAGVAALWAQKSIEDNDGDVVIGDVIDNLRFHVQKTPWLTRDDVGKGIVQAPQ